MIKASVLSKLLNIPIKNNVCECVFICNLSGDILAKEGLAEGSTLTDVVSTIWTEYSDSNLTQLFKSKELNFLLLECTEYFISATPLYGYILVSKSKGLNNLGLMKVYIENLAKSLDHSFKDIQHLISDKNNNENDDENNENN